MNTHFRVNSHFLGGIGAVILITGCVSTPVPNAALENARTVVQSTAADPNVAQYAPLDLQAARDELAIAESASLHHDDAATSQAGYIASQTARLAQLKASAKADDARVARGQAERDQIELAARNRDAQNAQAALDQANAKAAMLKAEASALKAKRQAN